MLGSEAGTMAGRHPPHTLVSCPGWRRGNRVISRPALLSAADVATWVPLALKVAASVCPDDPRHMEGAATNPTRPPTAWPQPRGTKSWHSDGIVRDLRKVAGSTLWGEHMGPQPPEAGRQEDLTLEAVDCRVTRRCAHGL